MSEQYTAVEFIGLHNTKHAGRDCVTEPNGWLAELISDMKHRSDFIFEVMEDYQLMLITHTKKQWDKFLGERQEQLIRVHLARELGLEPDEIELTEYTTYEATQSTAKLDQADLDSLMITSEDDDR